MNQPRLQTRIINVSGEVSNCIFKSVCRKKSLNCPLPLGLTRRSSVSARGDDCSAVKTFPLQVLAAFSCWCCLSGLSCSRHLRYFTVLFNSWFFFPVVLMSPASFPPDSYPNCFRPSEIRFSPSFASLAAKWKELILIQLL